MPDRCAKGLRIVVAMEVAVRTLSTALLNLRRRKSRIYRNWQRVCFEIALSCPLPWPWEAIS
jgi:hypothetical protein